MSSLIYYQYTIYFNNHLKLTYLFIIYCYYYLC